MAASTSENVTAGSSNSVILKIQDAHLTGPLNIKWGTGNNLLLHGRSPKSQIHEVQWDTSMYNVHARKFVSETNSIFMSIQKLAIDGKSDALRSSLVKISQKYRCVIKSFIDDLQSAADASSDSMESDALEIQSQIYFKIELLWNLCEIIYVDIPSGGALLVNLLNWIRWHFPHCENLAKAVTESENPSTHVSYWDTIYTFVLQGRINDVRKFLHMHSESKTEPFIIIDEILHKMPLYSHSHSHSPYDLIYQWQTWQEECHRVRNRGEFSGIPELDILCGILCGEKEIFMELMELCETWYHFMISYLLYTNPCVKAVDLQHLAQDYIDIYGGLSQMDELDSILLSALEFNILEVIKQSSQYFDSWWFVSHFTDLLGYCGAIRDENDSEETTLREFLLLEYASSLAGHCSMWQFAVDYFDCCPTQGAQMLESYLERIPLTNEHTALKVIQIAQERNMTDLVTMVCKVMSRKAFKNNRLGSAVTWALKSKDAVLVTYLADQFLIEYGEKGRFHSLALLDNLGSSILVSDRLTFLCKYREFHQLYAQEQFYEAGNILMQLLTSKFASKSFWKPLLLDALPLLESDKLILNADQTFELLHFLEEWHSAVEQEKGFDKSHEQLLRIAISKNLARAFTSGVSTDAE